MTPVFTLDPLRDPRWERLTSWHPRASVFHTSGWLETLSRTYGYRAVALTTSKPGEELQNGLVYCQVRSWLTGWRVVSLPFSDHCEPLASHPEELETLLHGLLTSAKQSRCKRVEIRSIGALPRAECDLGRASEFYFHVLDLRPGRDRLFAALHGDCVRRKIRRAEREHLVVAEGRSDALLTKFYDLQIIARRRHQAPPQPLKWFRNLVECMGDKLNIRVASKDGTPVAAIMTARFRNTLTYKYGCSDEKYHPLGGMQLVLWKAVEEALSLGMTELDLGRSDTDNPGLITFKDRWGAAKSLLSYSEYPSRLASRTESNWKAEAARKIFGYAPSACLRIAGNLLYKHIG